MDEPQRFTEIEGMLVENGAGAQPDRFAIINNENLRPRHRYLHMVADDCPSVPNYV